MNFTYGFSDPKLFLRQGCQNCSLSHLLWHLVDICRLSLCGLGRWGHFYVTWIRSGTLTSAANFQSK
jgi:hypothetical protein